MDKLLTPITLVESALWISFHELLCCKWLTDCTSSLLWPCNVLALSSWVCVLSREQNSWNSKFSTPFRLILKTSAVLCLQMYLIKISKLISGAVLIKCFFLLFWQFLPRLCVSSWRLCVDLFFKLWRTDYRWISKEQQRWKPRKRRWRKR